MGENKQKVRLLVRMSFDRMIELENVDADWKIIEVKEEIRKIEAISIDCQKL